MLSQFGQVTGVEMDAEAAQMAREKSAGAVIEGYLPNNFPISEGDVYELIVALDVLEHIDDDVASLARLKTLLSPGGRMLVTVPAFPWLWSSHDEAHHHKRRYTRLDLQQKIELAGLRSSYISYFNSLLFPAAALVRSLQRRLNGREDKSVSKVEVSVPGRWQNRVLYSLFVLEKYVIGKLTLPFGLSLVAVIELPSEGES